MPPSLKKNNVDFKSVSLRGAFNAGRARLIWRDGLLRAWGVQGFMFEVTSTEPKRAPGYIGRWDATTERGPLQIRFRCMGCGGKKWWKFMLVDDEELWSSV